VRRAPLVVDGPYARAVELPAVVGLSRAVALIGGAVAASVVIFARPRGQATGAAGVPVVVLRRGSGVANGDD